MRLFQGIKNQSLKKVFYLTLVIPSTVSYSRGLFFFSFFCIGVQSTSHFSYINILQDEVMDGRHLSWRPLFLFCLLRCVHLSQLFMTM